MRHQFSTIFGSGDISWVGTKIGGKVGDNIELGKRDPLAGFTNACAIRMSYSLNYSGAPVVRGAWATVSGADKNWYLFRVRDLLPYLTNTFGKADKTVKKPKESDFANMKGILVFSVPFADATGHATLWDGHTCSDHCYFPRATEASIWILK
jgi:hypothetical protein